MLMKHAQAHEELVKLILLADQGVTFTDLCNWVRANRPEVARHRVHAVVQCATRTLSLAGTATLVLSTDGSRALWTPVRSVKPVEGMKETRKRFGVAGYGHLAR